MTLLKPNVFVAVAFCLGAGIIGSLFTYPALTPWYSGLVKPSFTPPSWIFGPVWTILYILMGIAAYLVWKHDPKQKTNRTALSLFGIQLALNILWSLLFFGIKLPWLAFVEIVFLWIFIYFTINEFKKISPVGALLLVPYLLWVTFATLLTYSIASMN